MARIRRRPKDKKNTEKCAEKNQKFLKNRQKMPKILENRKGQN